MIHVNDVARWPLRDRRATLGKGNDVLGWVTNGKAAAFVGEEAVATLGCDWDVRVRHILVDALATQRRVLRVAKAAPGVASPCETCSQRGVLTCSLHFDHDCTRCNGTGHLTHGGYIVLTSGDGDEIVVSDAYRAVLDGRTLANDTEGVGKYQPVMVFDGQSLVGLVMPEHPKELQRRLEAEVAV